MENFKTGDLVFIRGTDIISDLVRIFDPGEFSHVVLIVNDFGEMIEANEGEKVQIMPFIYKDLEYKVVSPKYTQRQKANIFNAAQKYIGEDYDNLEIAGIVLAKLTGLELFRHLQNPHEQICSKLGASILIDVGCADKTIFNMTPNELYTFLTVNK